MKKQLFGNDIPPACIYCEFSLLNKNKEPIFCSKNQDFNKSACKRFRYNPLKRIPKTLPMLQKFDKSDFEI